MTDQPIPSMPGGLGWWPSSFDKKYKHNQLYSWTLFVPFVATSVEVVNTLPPEFRSWYDQGAKNACVGASTTQLMAMLNLKQDGLQRRYDWWRHYCLACEIDHDNATSCDRDIGTFEWAGLDVLRLNGAYLAGEGWRAEDGLEQYLWINPTRAVDETRTALAQGQLVAGASPWFEGFNPDRLIKVGDRWKFPPRSKWGRSLGGHAYGWYDALDSIQAFGMVNTWGDRAPDKVYMDYGDYEFLQTIGAECAVLVDKLFTPPAPPMEEQKYIDVEWPIADKVYAGRLVEV